MANLSITSACNRSCDYCFARPATARDDTVPEHMSVETFGRALDLLQRSGIDEARLLGGEPTMHPSFADLVEEALDRGLRLVLFTNGLMGPSVLECLGALLADSVTAVVNVTGWADLGREQREHLGSVLQVLGRRARLGMNINGTGPDMDFMLDLIAEHGLCPTIRLGLAHPCATGGNSYLPPRCYRAVGQAVGELARRACDAGVQLELDCGFVPCMFSEADLEALGGGAEQVGRRCNPILDVLPDGDVVACYPLAGIERVPLADVVDASELRADFDEALGGLRAVGVFRECSACSLRQTGACVGGCLAAAMRRLRSSSAAFSTSEDPVRASRSTILVEADGDGPDGRVRAARTPWVIPYVDQTVGFWQRVAETLNGSPAEVYLPLPGDLTGSGRPVQAAEHLEDFLGEGRFPFSVLINPVVLPRPVEEVAPAVIERLRRLAGDHGLCGVTVANLGLAARIKQELPGLSLVASVLMDVAEPVQALMLEGVCDTLVPSSRIMRDRSALEALRSSFSGRIRLIVNEACLPGCPFRVQHFYEMGTSVPEPRSLCDELLRDHPWLRLTGAWVLPQHLHLYDGVYDELKLAGRVTLSDPEVYLRVLGAYVHRRPLAPDAIGGGPASVDLPMEIGEEHYRQTLSCGRLCDRCKVCRDAYEHALMRQV